jgi:uncharacterized protein (TIGR02145 family)
MRKVPLGIFLIILVACQKQVDYMPQINALNDRVSSLQKSRDSISAALNQTNLNLATTNANIVTINKRVDSIKLKIDTIGIQISSLNTRLASTNETILTLNAKIIDLQNQIVQLNSSLNYILNGIIDIQGNKYGAILIGDQLWAQSNLVVTKFQNGDDIPEVKSFSEWTTYFNQGKPAFCYFTYNSTYKGLYGILYNWYAIKDARLLAPKGFRVPNSDDFDKLIQLYGGYAIAGGNLKSSSTWNSPNILNTNLTSFAAVAGGYMDDIGRFNFPGERVGFWTTTEAGPNYFKGIGLINSSTEVNNGISPRNAGMYVRFVKE